MVHVYSLYLIIYGTFVRGVPLGILPLKYEIMYIKILEIKTKIKCIIHYNLYNLIFKLNTYFKQGSI